MFFFLAQPVSGSKPISMVPVVLVIRTSTGSITSAVTAKIDVQNHRATGVQFYQGNQLQTVRARRELVVSAGAFGSPQLLQLSGIGAAQDLQKLGIAITHDLPGVGQNLQDHIDYVQSWSVPSNTASFGVSLRGTGKALCAMLEWRKQRSGMITSAIFTGSTVGVMMAAATAAPTTASRATT